MNSIRFFVILVFPVMIAAATAHAQVAGSSLLSKPLKEEATVVPFVWELDNYKFKPHDKEVPDELRVDINGSQLRISGVKKTDTKPIMGKRAGWFGKLALVPAAARSGTASVQVQTLRGVNSYGIGLELANGSLKCTQVALDANTIYTWKTEIKDSQFSFQLAKEGDAGVTLTAEAATIKSFGFFSTVRNPTSKADLTVEFK